MNTLSNFASWADIFISALEGACAIQNFDLKELREDFQNAYVSIALKFFCERPRDLMARAHTDLLLLQTPQHCEVLNWYHTTGSNIVYFQRLGKSRFR